MLSSRFSAVSTLALALVAGVASQARAQAPTMADLTSAQTAREANWKALEAQQKNTRAVGGINAEPGKWPSMVALLLQRPGEKPLQFCGGTVIGSQYVLTAAHCTAAMAEVKGNVTFFIKEGTTNLTAKDGNAIKITQLIPFDDYKPELTLNDLALVKLAAPAKSPRQKLVGTKDVPTFLVTDRMGTVTGFGRTTEGGDSSPTLRQVDLPVVPQDACQSIYGPERITGKANFCAGYAEGGKDSCQGDSGGPYFMPNETGEPIQAGVVSWGKGCARKALPGVYASVGRFEDWIRAKVPDAQFVSAEPAAVAGTAPPAVAAADAAVAPIVAGAEETPYPAANGQVSVDIPQGYTLKVGQIITINVQSSISGRLLLINQDVDGRAYQIFPSRAVPSGQPNGGVAMIQAGQVLTIPTARQQDQGFRFRIDPPAGKNRLIAIVVPAETRADDVLTRHADGNPIPDLPGLLKELTAAEQKAIVVEPAVAGAESAVKPQPAHAEAKPVYNRAIAERFYQIIP